jgi:hypothetical protein
MAAGSTYTPIATTTIGTAAASYTFSSIPSSYTDLELVFAGTDSTYSGVLVQFNGDTATNYSVVQFNGDGTTASSARTTSATSMNLGVTGTTQSNSRFSILSYSNTTTYKTVLGRGNTAANLVRMAVGLWRSTAAVNSITVSGTSLQVGSTITLYGIVAA